jgi:hypothetical protein
MECLDEVTWFDIHNMRRAGWQTRNLTPPGACFRLTCCADTVFVVSLCTDGDEDLMASQLTATKVLGTEYIDLKC